MAYKDFDVNTNYSTSFIKNIFILTEDYWKYKCLSYDAQDTDAKRDFTNNISPPDFSYFKTLLEHGCYHMCHNAFSPYNKPTLDRIDNSLPHTKDNAKPRCVYCTQYKPNKNENTTRLNIQPRNFALLHNLPFIISSKHEK